MEIRQSVMKRMIIGNNNRVNRNIAKVSIRRMDWWMDGRELSEDRFTDSDILCVPCSVLARAIKQ